MKRSLWLVLAVFTLAACASFTEKTQGLSLGMSTYQVKKILGTQYTVLASRYGADGRPIESWEFRNPDTGQLFTLAFKDDKLVQWGTPEALRSMNDLHGPDEGKPASQPATPAQ